jgi:predicted nucleic acid-binding protein
VIVFDANIVLRHLTGGPGERARRERKIAARLLADIEGGNESGSVSDAVLAEMVFILSSSRHYGLSREHVADLLLPILSLPGIQLSNRRAVLSALSLWVEEGPLSFVDALALCLARANDAQLATFDERLARQAGERLWMPGPET